MSLDNELSKSLLKLNSLSSDIQKKRREFNKIRNEKGKITTDMTEKQRIMILLQATV